jgi:GT2 family glycosyltransferase
MNQNISIVISTKSINEEINNYSKHLKQTVGLKDVELLIYENNGQYSLTNIYNKGLNDAKNEIVVFLHDDLEILTQNWGKKLINHFNNSFFGILGVAGTTELGKDGVWWSKKNKMCGNVFHLHENKKHLSKYSNSFGDKIIETAIIDGLFIAVNKNKLKSSFNEEFDGFHFYDLSFCIDNFNELVKIGVISNIDILHKSIGNVNEDFFNAKSKFLMHYDNILPIKSNTTLIVDNNKEIKIKNKPRTTIIIPHKDNNEILFNLLDSLYTKSDNNNIDVIIADTGSSEDNLNQLKYFLKYNRFLKLVEYDYYNFAKINNDVVKNHVSHETELLVFCNNDVEFLNDTINHMISLYIENKHVVGTVGARLHFPDNNVQHSGVVCKKTNNSHMFTHMFYKSNYTYYNNINKNIIGNTGALMLTSKKLFESIGGFNENYVECFEDVEYNLQCILNNKINIFCGYAVAYHHESLTRNISPEKQKNELIDQNRLMEFFNGNISKFLKYIS